jgi:drug/metabolite transporter (DMT)-like permease
MGQAFSGVLLLPVARLFPDLSQLADGWWRILLTSSCIHAVYVILLGWAYQIGDMSVVYPVARGVGIAGTSLLAVSLGIDHLSAIGAGGVLATVFGSSFVGLSQLRRAGAGPAFSVAFAVGLTISFYSLVDKIAASAMPPFLYVTMINIVSPLFLAPYMWKRHKPGVIDAWKRRKLVTLFVGLAGCAPYALILWAYQHTNASYVVALRETSVIVGAALGILVLKEHVSPLKLAGVAAIASGAILLRLA